MGKTRDIFRVMSDQICSSMNTVDLANKKVSLTKSASIPPSIYKYFSETYFLKSRFRENLAARYERNCI